jgi:hypothetical protein
MGYVLFRTGNNGLTCAYAHQMQSLVVVIGLRINVMGEAKSPLLVKLKHSFITLVHTNVITCNI